MSEKQQEVINDLAMVLRYMLQYTIPKFARQRIVSILKKHGLQ